MEIEIFKERGRQKLLVRSFKKAKNRLVGVVSEIKDMMDKSMAGCIILVEQVENDKIFDKGHEI